MLLNILATGTSYHPEEKITRSIMLLSLPSCDRSYPDLDSNGVSIHNERRMVLSRSGPGSCTNRPHTFKNLGPEVYGL